jgi:nitroreductase
VADPLLDAVLGRRSVRSGFDGRAVRRDVLQQIIACGEAAPSSKNAQPWRFHIMSDAGLIGRCADAVVTADGIETYVPRDPRTGQPYPEYTSTVLDSAAALRSASAAIWVENLGTFSGGRAVLSKATPAALTGSLVGYGLELIGVGAAVENMWLGANALGLSAAFMGDVIIAEPRIRELLGFEGDLMGVLVVGYSSASRGPSELRRALPDQARAVWHGETS